MILNSKTYTVDSWLIRRLAILIGSISALILLQLPFIGQPGLGECFGIELEIP